MDDNMTRYDDMDSERLTIDEDELDQFVRLEKSETRFKTCFADYLINEQLMLCNVSCKLQLFNSGISIFSLNYFFAACIEGLHPGSR